MTITGPMQGTIRDPDKLPGIAQYGLLLGVIAVSVTGWITAVPFGGLILATFAAFLEVQIFFGLPKWLDHFKRRQWAKLTFLTAILAMAGVLNSVGLDYGLQFVLTSMQAPLDAAVRAEQAGLDNRRNALLDRIANIATAQQQLATQAPPNAETTNSYRLREWQAIHDRQAQSLSQQLTDARGALDQVPLTAAPRYAYPVWGRHVAAGLLFFISMFVRFAWGFEAHAMKPAVKVKSLGKRSKKVSRTKRSQVSHQGVIDLKTERAARDKRDAETVKRLAAEGMSVRDIERETNKQISKSRAQRLLSAQ